MRKPGLELSFALLFGERYQGSDQAKALNVAALGRGLDLANVDSSLPQPILRVAIIDRLAGGEAAFNAKGLPLITLTTIRDFGIEPE